MVSPDHRSYQIADAFSKYLESKDESLIEKFTRDEIEIALLQLIKNGDYPYYAAMQIRREELKKIENNKREKSDSWKARMTIFIAGLFLALVMLFLKLIFFP